MNRSLLPSQQILQPTVLPPTQLVGTKTKRGKKHTTHNYLSGGGSGKHKLTTKHLAALDFLLGIKLTNESAIRQSGQATALASAGEVTNEGQTSGTLNQYESAIVFDAPGKKLQGSDAPTAHIPSSFRYKMMKILDEGADIHKWESSLLRNQQQPILSSRLFFSQARSYPFLTLSVIGYRPEVEQAKLDRKAAEDNRGNEVFETVHGDWRGRSYHRYFAHMAAGDSSYPEDDVEIAVDEWLSRGYMHDPYSIDNPQGTNEGRKTADNSHPDLPIICSIILYKNPEELKRSLNESFRERHPQLPSSLTLSKIQKLKKSILLGCMNLDIEVSTVAMACIYFEKLCLKGLVTKKNRRLTMATCTCIALKFNEARPKQNKDDVADPKLHALLRFIDTEYRISSADILKYEWGVFAALDFRLAIPRLHVNDFFLRLLKLVYKSPRIYLGEALHEEFANIFSFLGKPLDKRYIEELDAQQKVSLFNGLKCPVAFQTWLEETKDTTKESIYEVLSRMVESPSVCECDCLKNLVVSPEPHTYVITKEAQGFRQLQGLTSWQDEDARAEVEKGWSEK